jgi:hypothetical protein
MRDELDVEQDDQWHGEQIENLQVMNFLQCHLRLIEYTERVCQLVGCC